MERDLEDWMSRTVSKLLIGSGKIPLIFPLYKRGRL
jgi:hypothetical protein